LGDIYPDYRQLFCNTLEIVDASWETLIEEAQRIEAFDNLEYISDVFIAINDHLSKGDTVNRVSAVPKHKEYVPALKNSRIFPTGAKKSDAAFDQLSTAEESDMWFIADRWHLRQSFEGMIPMLALSVDCVNKVRPLLERLGLEYRMLSRIVSGVPKTEGPTLPQCQYTTLLRAKARSIARYVLAFMLNRQKAQCVSALRLLLICTPGFYLWI
jgi:hypothetical protein